MAGPDPAAACPRCSRASVLAVPLPPLGLAGTFSLPAVAFPAVHGSRRFSRATSVPDRPLFIDTANDLALAKAPNQCFARSTRLIFSYYEIFLIWETFQG